MTEAVFPHEPEAISQDKLDQVAKLASRAQQLEQELAELDEQVSTRSKELSTILGGYQQPGQLVELMASIGDSGMDTFTLGDGTRVVVNQELKAPSMGQGGKYREIVVDWLRKTGNEDVIKGELIVNLPKGLPDEKIKALEATATDAGLQSKRLETVNAQTLGALLREMLEKGEDVPLDQLGAMLFKRAEILQVKDKE